MSPQDLNKNMMSNISASPPSTPPNHCKTWPLGLLLESWHILSASLLGVICKVML